MSASDVHHLSGDGNNVIKVFETVGLSWVHRVQNLHQGIQGFCIVIGSVVFGHMIWLVDSPHTVHHGLQSNPPLGMRSI
ncbi:hypothetical protein BDR03DRAFT_939364 [Suillus americanus]|nr:hypothetical protein BDR03DRAFT_939364 [Suillus americanus]